MTSTIKSLILTCALSLASQANATGVATILGDGTVNGGTFALGAGLSAVTFPSGNPREGQFGMTGFTTADTLNTALVTDDFFSLSVALGNPTEPVSFELNLDRGATNRPPRNLALYAEIDNSGLFGRVGSIFDADGVAMPSITWDLSGLAPATDLELRVYGYGGAGVPNNELALKGVGDPVTGIAAELTVEMSPVPIPGALPLMVAGLGGLMVLRRRKAAA